MSQRHPTEHELVQLRQACRCGAAPGQWCQTKRGSQTAYLHSRRPTTAPPRPPREPHVKHDLAVHLEATGALGVKIDGCVACDPGVQALVDELADVRRLLAGAVRSAETDPVYAELDPAIRAAREYLEATR